MLRALSEDMNVSFTNNDRTNEIVIIINRNTGNQVSEKSNQVEGKSNQVNGNLDTKLRHSDTDLGTDSDTFDNDSDTRLGYSDTDLDANSDTFGNDSDAKRPKITNKQKNTKNLWNNREKRLKYH